MTIPRALICLVLALPSSAGAEAARPNVLFILADDMRADSVGAHGNAAIRTPNLDRLAAAGTSLTNAHILGTATVAAVCAPSRIAIMTGASPFRASTGFVWPKAMSAAGYATFHAGKPGNECRVALQAFERSLPLAVGYKPVGERLDVGADAIIDFVRSQRARPWFVYFAPQVPHDPLNPGREDLAAYAGERAPPLPADFAPSHPGFPLRDTDVRPFELAKRTLSSPIRPEDCREMLAAYHAMVSALDRQVGRMLDALERDGQLSRTLIVFTADHGIALGSHGLLHKQSVYQHDVRVPLIMAGPGVPRGERRDALVYLSDLAPTIAALAGMAEPAGRELVGRSFAASLRDARAAHRSELVHVYRDEMRALREGDRKLVLYAVADLPPGWKAHHSGMKLPAGTTVRPVARLYDLAKDPAELADIAARPEEAPRVERMARRLRELTRELGEGDGGEWTFWRHCAALVR